MGISKEGTPRKIAKLTNRMAICLSFAMILPSHAEDSNPAKIQSLQRLALAEKARLTSLLAEQMMQCINYKAAAPKVSPQIALELGSDGTITAGPELKNSSSEATFQPFVNAIISALRKCQPYSIPQGFHETLAEWKRMLLRIDTSDLQDPPKPPKR